MNQKEQEENRDKVKKGGCGGCAWTWSVKLLRGEKKPKKKVICLSLPTFYSLT